MLKTIAAGALLAAATAAASAQTTLTNPDLLAPPISQTTPGGDANASDTGVHALNAAATAQAEQDARTRSTVTPGAHHRDKRQPQPR